MPESTQKEQLKTILLNRVSADTERRAEAIYEFLSVTAPGIEAGVAARVAELMPPLLTDLYARWTEEFLETLYKTVPERQITEFLSSGEEGEATLVLVYLMFMESERMEQQVPEDIQRAVCEHAAAQKDEAADVLAVYLRAKLAVLAERAKGGAGGC